MTILILGVVFWAVCKMFGFGLRWLIGVPLDENLEKLTKEYDKHSPPEYYQELQRQSEEEQKQYDDWGFIE